MKFSEVVAQTLAWLQREGRVSYGALKREFDLDDEYVEDLKTELIKAKRVAVDEDGKVLVWKGGVDKAETENRRIGEPEKKETPSLDSQTPDSEPRAPSSPSSQTLDSRLRDSRRDAGERRQLTVQFIDLVGSTALSTQLDPEELREVIQAYRETCATLIRRFDGHLAKYIGDGLLVYFGYPLAHEDDAQRAVRTALGIIEAIQRLSFPTIQLPRPLQVRIGIHTGLVVAGEMGVGDQPEPLAIVGETPNIAARLQGVAEPDTVVISGATYRLVQGFFECQDRGSQELKGLSTPLPLYRVVRESATQSRFEVAVTTGLTLLVGREEELGLLRRRWEQAKAGEGQVVLLSGEPGIGKSRLVQELTEQLKHEGVTRLEFRCSPYHQNSALYPIIDHLQRLLQFAREDTPATKLEKLQHTLSHYCFPQADTFPLLAALLSLPHPVGYPPITVSPQKQKEKTQAALVAWLVEEAEQRTIYTTWEDVHWTDPSTLEVLNLVIDQAPTAKLYVLLTFRPEFTPPWGNRSHLSQLTLSRLGRSQVDAMVERVTSGKTLPAEIVQQIVAKTDGVPLFVEELTKTVLEAELDVGARLRPGSSIGHVPLLQIGIPATLQDALMARLDRLGRVKEVAQLGAAVGREFTYELIHAVSPLDEERLQQGLKQLVEAELVYQRGLVPQAHYLFKHALIQDTAYQSLLKSTRQQYHRQIAQVLTEQFPETIETQPELLAHHYTEAGQIEQALPHWQKAGERATQRSANVEAVSHLTKGLELLTTLPDTPKRTQHELTLQITLGAPLTATKGYAAPEVGKVYTRARELCQQVGETPQLMPVLFGLWRFYLQRAALQTARELGEQGLSLAQRVQDPAGLLRAHNTLGVTLFFLGELSAAREHLEQGIALYTPQQRRSPAFVQDPLVVCLSYAAWTLWHLGYPDQALRRSQEALALAGELSHPYSLATALFFAAELHYLRREVQAVRERAEAAITLSAEQGFPFWLAQGKCLRGWALAQHGQEEEGIIQMRQGLAIYEATGAELGRPYWLVLPAGTYGKGGRTEEGLAVLAEALAAADKTGERYYEAELYRIKGELMLQKFQVSGSKFQVENSSESGVKVSLGQVQDKSQTSLEQVRTSQDKSAAPNTQPPTPSTQAEVEQEAEECFHKAIAIAQRQQAKSLELRAVMSLVRLRQQQMQHATRTTQHEARNRPDTARNTLSEIYNWFTEGFDTKDLQEAKALLEAWGH